MKSRSLQLVVCMGVLLSAAALAGGEKPVKMPQSLFCQEVRLLPGDPNHDPSDEASWVGERGGYFFGGFDIKGGRVRAVTPAAAVNNHNDESLSDLGVLSDSNGGVLLDFSDGDRILRFDFKKSNVERFASGKSKVLMGQLTRGFFWSDQGYVERHAELACSR